MSARPSGMLCKSQRSHCHSARRLCSRLAESSSLPSKKRRSKLLSVFFISFFFFPPPPPLIALSSPSALAIFGPQLFVLASAQKKEVPFQKRAIGMMGRQFFSEGKCYSFFPSKGKLKYNKIKSLDNLRRHQHH